MPLIPSNSEVVARYIFFSKYIRSSNNTVKWSAFMPSEKDNETSVFRISGLSDQEIWKMANEEVVPNQTNTLKGRADIPSSDVMTNLILSFSEPPYRHAAIIGWSTDKSKNMSLAMELEEKASQFIPSP